MREQRITAGKKGPAKKISKQDDKRHFFTVKSPNNKGQMQQRSPQKETFLLQCFTNRTDANACKFESHKH